MSKLMSGQIKEGQGKEYHLQLFDTYILVISKNNLFVGNTAIK